MFKNYLKTALRNLTGNKLFSLINIIGFAISMACVVLILLFVNHELRYDRHWEKADRTHKVMTTFMPMGNYAGLEIALTGSIIAVLLEQEFPQVEETVRIVAGDNIILGRPEENVVYSEPGIYFADASFPEVFDVPLAAGTWEGALDQPAQLVINQTLARKYFGDSDPIGQSLLVANSSPMRITAVMQDLGDNTHLKANAIISMATAEAFFGPEYTRSWSNQVFHTYVVLREGADAGAFAAALPEFLQRHASDDPNDNTALDVMPVADIHLHSHRDYEMSANGSLLTVYTFSALAAFVLMIACFNFMNLSTARSIRRAREVGMRKTLGANRSQLIQQFLGESTLIACLAIVLAIGLVEIVLPLFNATIDLNVGLNYLSNPGIILVLLAMAVGIGLLAGIYPAVVLSSFSSISILKGNATRGKAGALFRQLLVVFQFAISIALVIAAIVVLSQLRYARSLDLGYQTEQIAIYDARGVEGLGLEYEAMKQELLRHPDILAVTAADLMPGDLTVGASGLRAEGEQVPTYMPAVNVDYDYFETFDIPLIAGRAFARDRNDLYTEPTPDNPLTAGNFILNLAAASQIGLTPQEAVGSPVQEFRGPNGSIGRVNGDVIGVIEDIHFESLREQVQPLYFRLTESRSPSTPLPLFTKMAIRLSGNDINGALAHADAVWQRFLPGSPIQRRFLDEKFAELYAAERRQGTIFTSFSIVAIFITAIGLYGLASFVTEQRTREIGIRKVLGSTVLGVVTLLSKDFGRLVLIANLIAWPLAWYFMSDWLQRFAYRIDLSPAVFLLAGGMALVLALVTVSSLAFKVANRNPVESLRYE